ncbi:TIGR04168 family protein [Prochlorococcus marinus]|uniref:TIGR04168 family protein n=1 Tax=Prochlorococcus marinus TaxID=1219 RepID=UPI000673E6F6|nr:TIGR04168 family protein [Prochlorococcus marinus]
MNLAIAGDLHGSWVAKDKELLIQLCPDAVLFVGDLSDGGDLRLIKAINSVPIPSAVILGNHDRGLEPSGYLLQQQLTVLGERDCSWRLRGWSEPPLSVVGARPCSPGGGYYLSNQVKGVFGPVSLEESVARIYKSALKAAEEFPLVLLAHAGPTGLGSDASSLCGRDWKIPAIDWGDQDLSMAIDLIRKKRKIDLVVFGHMHHQLKRGRGNRKTFVIDQFGTAYLNAACVPRRKQDEFGNWLSHFSWAKFINGKLAHVSHRWFREDSSIAFQETLYQINI